MTKCLANINVCGLLFHRILEFHNLSSLTTPPTKIEQMCPYS